MQIQGREKILGIAVLSCVGIFIIFMLVQGAILKPAQELKRQKAQLVLKLNKMKKEQEQYKIAEKEVTAAGKMIINGNSDQVNGEMGEFLNEVIQKVELNPRAFTRSPVGPNRVGKGGAKEIGWTVQGEGSLEKIIDLLYLLENSQAFHKLDGIKFTPVNQPGWVKVAFRYLTIVLDPVPDAVKKSGVTNIVVADLTTPERQLYQGIVARDIFRPYVKRPPEVKPQEPSPANQEQATNNQPTFKPEIWKVVSLSEWAGKVEIHLMNTENNSVHLYTPGDKIEGWTLLGVDYRRMPIPNSILYSDSRVILQNAEGYWAVEPGSTLAQLHQMKVEDLPSNLKPKEEFIKDNDN